MTVYLTVEQVIRYHDRESTAPLIDRAALEGACNRPLGGFGDQMVHTTIWTQAAALLHGIDRAQAFEDGNKRTAWMSTMSFLHANGFHIRATQQEAYAFALEVGDGAHPLPDIAIWLFERSSLLP